MPTYWYFGHTIFDNIMYILIKNRFWTIDYETIEEWGGGDK